MAESPTRKEGGVDEDHEVARVFSLVLSFSHHSLISKSLSKNPWVCDIYGPAPLVGLVRSTITKDDNFIQSDSFFSSSLVLEP